MKHWLKTKTTEHGEHIMAKDGIEITDDGFIEVQYGELRLRVKPPFYFIYDHDEGRMYLSRLDVPNKIYNVQEAWEHGSIVVLEGSLF